MTYRVAQEEGLLGQPRTCQCLPDAFTFLRSPFTDHTLDESAVWDWAHSQAHGL